MKSSILFTKMLCNVYNALFTHITLTGVLFHIALYLESNFIWMNAVQISIIAERLVWYLKLTLYFLLSSTCKYWKVSNMEPDCTYKNFSDLEDNILIIGEINCNSTTTAFYLIFQIIHNINFLLSLIKICIPFYSNQTIV